MTVCYCRELEGAALVLELVEQALPAALVMPATPERHRNRRATVIEWPRAGRE